MSRVADPGAPPAREACAIAAGDPPGAPAFHWPVLLWAVYLANVALQSRSLARVVVPALDEGVYLCAARLMADGLVPFRDFLLTHPPFLVAAAAAGLTATGGDVPLFSLLYVCWVFSALFPLAFVVRRLSGSAVLGVVAAAFLSLSPMFAGYDARYFALRQASLPFLLWGLSALLARRPVAAGLLLGLFSVGVATNAVLAVSTIAAFFLFGPAERGARRRDTGMATAALVVVLAAGVASVAAVPRGVESVIGFQLERPRSSLASRAEAFRLRALPQEAPLLLLGLAGALLARGPARVLGWGHALALPLVLLGPRSFYPHYAVVFLPGLAGCASLLMQRIGSGDRWRALVASLAFLGGTAAISGPGVATGLFRGPTDGILRVIDVLRRSPEPILSYEPIYALHAGRRLTFHRHVADMRSLVFVRPNVSEAEFARLLRESGTVLVEPRFASLLTAGRRRALDAAFEPVFFEPPHAVLVRRDLLPGRKPPG